MKMFFFKQCVVCRGGLSNKLPSFFTITSAGESRGVFRQAKVDLDARTI